MELRFIREVLEGTFAPDQADEILSDALEQHPTLETAADVLEFCRGPLAALIEERAGAGMKHAVLESLEPVLGASVKRATMPPPSEITDTAPGSLEGLDIDVDVDEDKGKTTVQIPMAEGGRVSVLIIAKSNRLADTLLRALGDDRVVPQTTNDEQELRRAIFSMMPNLLVVDAAYDPSEISRGGVATVMKALPVSIQPVVWGSDTEYGRGLVGAMKAAGAEAAYLDRTTGIATLLDLVRARLAS